MASDRPTGGAERERQLERHPPPPSRILAATAAAMRAIELRQDQARVVAAARSAAEAFKPVAEQSGASSPNAPVRPRSSDFGEAPRGVVRGQVAGFVKRDVSSRNNSSRR